MGKTWARLPLLLTPLCLYRSRSMSESLLYQYDQITDYIGEYHIFYKNIAKRGTADIAADIDFLKRTLKVLLSKNRRQFSYPRFKNNDLTKARIAECATEHEKISEYFNIAMSDYPIDTLTAYLKEKFREADFSKLKKIHESRKVYIPEPNKFSYIGFIGTISALVLKPVPKDIIESYTWMTYENYEKWVYILTTSVFAYVLLLLFVHWKYSSEAKSIHTFVGVVLEYTIVEHIHT
jgi:hypothetical protein